MSKKNNKVDGLFVILFGPLILKIVSPLDPHSLIARRNPGFFKLILRMPDCSKPLTEPMLIQIYGALWHLKAAMS